jgi:hypothetical protein
MLRTTRTVGARAEQLQSAASCALGAFRTMSASSLVAAHELAQAAPGAAGGIAADDELQASLAEQVDQPGGRVATVEQQHVGGREFVQRIGQHGAFGLAGRVHGGMQREFGARQRYSANRR